MFMGVQVMRSKPSRRTTYSVDLSAALQRRFVPTQDGYVVHHLLGESGRAGAGHHGLVARQKAGAAVGVVIVGVARRRGYFQAPFAIGSDIGDDGAAPLREEHLHIHRAELS